MPPGDYVLGAQVSRRRRAARRERVGRQRVRRVGDRCRRPGARLAEIRGAGTPIYDASFTDDGRMMYLGVVDGRFQIFVDGAPVSDAPYAVLAAREARGTIRFLDREGWSWDARRDRPRRRRTAVAQRCAPSHAIARTAVRGVPIVRVRRAVQPVGALLLPAATLADDRRRLERAAAYRRGRSAAAIASACSAGASPGYVQPARRRFRARTTTHYGADAEYLNTMLAPWAIIATAGFVDWVDPVDNRRSERHARRRSPHPRRVAVDRADLARLADDDAGRRSTPTTSISRRISRPSAPPSRRPGAVAVDLASVESTPLHRPAACAVASRRRRRTTRTRCRRSPATSTTSAARSPPSCRCRSGAATRSRSSCAAARCVARDDTGLLQLGGDSGLAELWTHRSISADARRRSTTRGSRRTFASSSRCAATRTTRSPPTARRSPTSAWRYPLIIDRGIAATLWRPARRRSSASSTSSCSPTGAIDRAQRPPRRRRRGDRRCSSSCCGSRSCSSTRSRAASATTTR